MASTALFHAPPLANYVRSSSFPRGVHPLADAFADACRAYWDDGEGGVAPGLANVGAAEMLDALHAAAATSPTAAATTDDQRPFPLAPEARAAWAAAGPSMVAEMFRMQISSSAGVDHAMVTRIDAPSVEKHFATAIVTHAPTVLVLELKAETFVAYDVTTIVGGRRYVLFAVVLRDGGTGGETALCLRPRSWTHFAADGSSDVVAVNDVIQKDATMLLYLACPP